MYHPQLDAFIIVAETGSFSKAAEILFVSPTAIMKQVNSLEERLSLKLFNRTNQGLSLTQAGESLLQDAKYLKDYSKRAVDKAKEIENKANHDSIRIGTSVMTPAKFILDIWADIQQAAPKMKIELIPFDNTPENAREILKNLGSHIDVVTSIYDENLMMERNFQAEELERKPLCMAFPITHPLANKQSISADDLKTTEVLFIRPKWNKYIDALREEYQKRGIKIKDFDFFSLSAFNKAVKENLPIIAIEGWENIHPLLKIVPLEEKYTIPFGIMYSNQPSTQVVRFISIVKKISSNR